jgi:hypothetical protein
MSTYDLASDSGLRAAVEAIGTSSTWTVPQQQWIRDLAETIRWVRSSDETQRGMREFQKRLWDDNHVAAIGRGNIGVDLALDDADFRRRFAERSMAPLPVSMEERLRFLTAIEGKYPL